MNKYGLEADISYFESCEELCEKSDFNRGGIMTINEIIETLEVAKAEVEWNYPLNYAVAIDAAIKALEKQIPKKPNKAIDNSWGTNKEAYACPVCDYFLSNIHFIGNGAKESYCEICGQKIDWSEETDET